LKRDPHAGDLYIFRGRRGDLVKILWHDGIGLSLYAIWTVGSSFCGARSFKPPNCPN
jgi:transposase